MAWMRDAASVRFRPDTIALLAATAFICAVNVATAVLAFGAHIDYGLQALPAGSIIQLEPGGPARAAGVQIGDTVVPAPAPGDVLAGYRMTYEPAGAVLHIKTPHGVVAVAAGPGQRIDELVNVASLIGSIVFLACAAFLYVRRPGAMAFALWLYAIGSVVAGSMQGPLLARLPAPAGLVLWIVIAGWVLYGSPLALFPFVLRFPTGSVAPRWRALDTAAWILMPLSAIFGGLLTVATFAQVISYYQAYAFFGAVGQLIVVAALILLFRYTRMSAVERARTSWALAAFVGSMLAFEANVVGAVVQNTLSIQLGDAVNVMFGRTVIGLAIVAELLPLLAIYPILRYRLFDLGFVVNRATLYSVLTLAAVATLAGVNWLAQKVVTERLALVVQPVAAIVIGLGYMRVRGWTQTLLERTFFRDRFRAETRLTSMAASFALEPRVEVIDTTVAFAAPATLSLASGAVFRRSGERFTRTVSAGWEDATRETIVAGAPDVRDLLGLDGLPPPPNEPVLAIGLANGADLVGIAFYGRHLNGTEIDPEESAMLQRLCDAAATAYRVAELQSEVARLREQLGAVATS